MKFFGEKEVRVKFSGEKEVMVKPLGGKEAMVIDEDQFPPAASINIVGTDSRAMLNAKKARRFSPSARIRKVWIPKQYLTYKNDLAAKGIVPTTREWKKNGRYPCHAIHLKNQNMKQRTRSSLRKRMFLQKRDMFLQGKRA